jgi:hypothetical protein
VLPAFHVQPHDINHHDGYQKEGCETRRQEKRSESRQVRGQETRL